MARKRTQPSTVWVPLSFKLDVTTYEAFKALAEREHRTMAGEVRRLVEARIAETNGTAKQAA